MENRKIKGKRMLRPLLLVSAVGIACQSIVAQAAPTIASTPFANRPLHLQNDTVKLEATRPKPNVMFFVDDSGSMQSLVGGKTEKRDNDFVRHFPNPKKYTCQNNTACYKYTENGKDYYTYDPTRRGLETEGQYMLQQLIEQNYANAMPCSFSLSTLGTDNTCYRLYWPLDGFFRLKQQNNRIRIAIDALTAVVNKRQDNWNWNIYTLWGSEERRFAKRNGAPSWQSERHEFMNAAEMKEYLKGLSPTGNTPSTERYVQLARIMKDSIEYRCQKSYVVMVSDGDANAARIPELNSEEEKLYGKFTFSNNGSKYVREFNKNSTDYYPYRSGVENGISLFSNILASADLKDKESRVGSGQVGRDKEGGFWDRHVNPNNPDDPYNNTEDTVQSIKTFTVGFGKGLSENGKAYLRDAATCEEPKDKCFFTPTTAEELAEALDIIQENIAAENALQGKKTFSGSTPAASGSTIAELAATLTLDTSNWSSELKFARFNSGKLEKDKDGKLVMVNASYAGRKVIVNNGTNKYWLNGQAPYADFGITTAEEFRKAFLPWLLRDSSKTDRDIEKSAALLPKRTVRAYRIRSETANAPERQMADVIDTPVVALGRVAADNAKQKYIVTAANDGMVYIFQSTNDKDKDNPPYALKLNYLPAAMQRQSKDDTLTVGKSIRATAEAEYGKSNDNPHVYLNNGGISWILTPKTGKMNQEYVLLGNMGQGGRGVYALRVGGEKRSDLKTNIPAGMDAPESEWLTEVPMWETKKGVDNALGYTIGTSIIAQVATNWDSVSGKPKTDKGVRLYAFVPNGYSTGEADIPYDTSPALYVYDMMGQEFGTDMTKDEANSTLLPSGKTPGTFITKIEVGGGAAGALATPTLVDSNFDGVVDLAYAGDQFGNMHRFDLRDEPGKWKSVMLYEGKKDADGKPVQPITAAPAIYRRNASDLVVIFGTGSDIYDKDRHDLNQQMVMGIYDDLDQKAPSVIKHNDNSILDQKITEEAKSGKKVRYLSNKDFSGNHRAWRVLLNEGENLNNDISNMTASEKVVVQPKVLLSTVFLTTRIYKFEKTENPLPKLPNGHQLTSQDRTCFIAKEKNKTAGTSFLMGFDVLTGGNPRADRGAYFDSGSSNPNDPLIAGEDLGSIASAATLLNVNKVGGDSWQVNENGEIQSTGEGTSLDNPSRTRKPNNCIPAGEAIKLLFASDSGVGLKSIKGKICETSLIRTDWREIPL